MIVYRKCSHKVNVTGYDAPLLIIVLYLQLLQGEENLLNLMMENSTWKTPHLGRKPRGSNKPRPRGSTSPFSPPQTPLSAAGCSPSTAKPLWSSSAEDRPNHGGRRGERSKSSSRALQHHQHTRSSNPPPQPPVSKMDSCHISEGRGTWDNLLSGSTFTSSVSSPVCLRLSRQNKSRGRANTGSSNSSNLPLSKDTSLLDATETDGYYSDAEQSDSDTRSGGRKLRLPQLHSGSEDLLRRSVLAS